MARHIFSVYLALLLGNTAFAASSDSLHGIGQNIHKPENSNHWYSNPFFFGSFKSQNNVGRMSTFGQSLTSKEEIVLGVKTPKGWGMYAMVATTLRTANPSSSSSSIDSGGSGRLMAKSGGKKRNQENQDNPTPASTNYGDFSGNK